MNALGIGLMALLLTATPSPFPEPTPKPPPPPPTLVVTGRLTRIGHGAGCGYYSMGVVAEYADLEVLDGSYEKDKLYVVHGCPELSRPRFSSSAGSLETFEIGAYHRLELASENYYQLELVYGDEIRPAQTALFYVLRVDPAKRPREKPDPVR